VVNAHRSEVGAERSFHARPHVGWQGRAASCRRRSGARCSGRCRLALQRPIFKRERFELGVDARLLPRSQRSLTVGAFELRGNARLLPRTLRDISRLCTWPRRDLGVDRSPSPFATLETVTERVKRDRACSVRPRHACCVQPARG
jgi:hypothetical protein